MVDNNSPRRNLDWLLERDGVNVALNRIEPLPPEAQKRRRKAKYMKIKKTGAVMRTQ